MNLDTLFSENQTRQQVISEAASRFTAVVFGRVAGWLLCLTLLLLTGSSAFGATTPTFIQEKDNQISSGQINQVTLSRSTTAGNLLAVYLIWDNTGAASVSDSLGNSYASPLGPTSWSNGNYRAQVFYTINLKSGVDTVKATFTASVTSFGIVYAHEYSGISQTAPLDLTVAASGASGSLTSGTATTTNATDLLFAGGVSANVITSPGAGYTPRATSHGNMTEDKISSAKGPYSATASNSGGAWAMQMVAFRGASSGTPPTTPTITTQPANQTSLAGQTATFTVIAVGTGPLSYQWQENGTAISGATASSYTTPATTTADNGTSFQVVVTNSAGSMTSAVATLTVNPAATLQSIAVSPSSPSISQSQTQQFTATGTYSDGSTKNITTTVTWASSNTAVAIIGASAGLASGVGAGTSQMTATLGSVVSPNDSLTVTAVTLRSITVTPASPSISQFQIQQFTATGTYSDGSTGNITSTVTWTSSNVAVATIGASTGLATGVTAGTSQIKTTLGTVASATDPLTVNATALGHSYTTNFPLTENPISEGGNWINGGSVGLDWSNVQTTAHTMSWGAQTPGKGSAQYNDSIAILAGAWGANQTIQATVGAYIGYGDEVELHLRANITAHSAKTYEIDCSNTFLNIVKWLGPLGSYTYLSSTGGYSCPTGTILKATATGTTTTVITVWINGVQAAQVTDSNNPYTSGSPGMGFYVSDSYSENQYQWFTSFTATDTGAPTITLQSIAVTPANPSINQSQTQQFTATGTYSDGSTQNVTATATWASSNTAVATIGANTGFATGVTVGPSQISATLGTVVSPSDSLTVTGTAITLKSIAVTPSNPSISQSQIQQFIATGTYSDGSSNNITSTVTWASSSTSVATIGAKTGTATGVAAGTSQITASLGSIVSTSNLLIVTAPILQSIALTPANPTISQSQAQQFTAMGTYSDSTIQNITTAVSWASSNSAVATIGANTGLATGITAGTSQITATLGSILSPGIMLTVNAAGNSYTTQFPLTENPIAEGGNWLNGKTNGLDWTDVQTTPGLAFGTETGISSGTYDDSIAVLTGSWPSNQMAQAAVHTVSQNSNLFEDVELRLRTTISAHNITGYVFNFRATADGSQYVQIVRWNGAFASFTNISTATGPGLHDGDTVSATAVGSTLTACINGVPIAQGIDSSYTNGSPGIGFFLQGGSAVNANYGFSNFTASIASTQDTSPPSPPQNLAANAISPSEIDLSWSASIDNVSVVGYQVFRNNTKMATTATLTYADQTVVPGVQYTYAVTALDAAGNVSAQSTAVLAQTSSASDITPPSVPANLQSSNVTSSSLTVTWSASTDNVGVAGYRVFRNGTQVGTSVATSYADTGLAASTNYTYTVAAYDASGNASAQSQGLSVTTTSAAVVTPTFVQVNNNEISSGTRSSVTFAAPTSAGNTIVVYVIWNNSGSVALTDSSGNTFVNVGAPVSWGSGYSAQVFYATNIVGGADIVTAAFRTSVTLFGVIYVHEYAGISTVNPVDVTTAASGSSATLNSGSATTTSANDLIFGAGVSDNTVSSAGSGFISRDVAYGNITEDRIAGSIGSYSATATHDGKKWGMQLVAFRAAQ